MKPTFKLMPDPGLATDFGGMPVICVAQASVDSTTTFVDANQVVFDLSAILPDAVGMFTGSLLTSPYVRRFANAYVGNLAKEWTKGSALVVQWQLENSTAPTDQYDGISFHFSVSLYGFGITSTLRTLFGEPAQRHTNCPCDGCVLDRARSGSRALALADELKL